MAGRKVNFKITIEGTCDADEYAVPMEIYDLYKSLVEYSKEENSNATVNMQTGCSGDSLKATDDVTFKKGLITPVDIKLDETNVQMLAQELYMLMRKQNRVNPF
ncbi:hypothetical protein CN527_02400 [Bacillus cereus]|nr:hypothetical protein CN527_02400 [Bacillus cereus]